MLTPSEFEHPFPTKRSPDAVGKTAVVRACQVALIVARVEVVRDVEHLDPDRRVVAKHAQAQSLPGYRPINVNFRFMPSFESLGPRPLGCEPKQMLEDR